MNFKQTIMSLSLLGLISQVAVAGEGYRPVPDWYANPYYFTTEAYDVGSNVCGRIGNALGEISQAAKETGSFICEYPKSSAFTSIAAVIATLWLYQQMKNYFWGSTGAPSKSPSVGGGARSNQGPALSVSVQQN